MAFPSTSIYESGTGANENPLTNASAGGTFSAFPGLGGIGLTPLQRNTNKILGAASNSYLVGADSNNCEHYATLDTLGASGDLTDLLFSIIDIGAVTTIKGYSFKAILPNTLQLTIITNLAASPIAGGTFTQTLSAGDGWGVRRVGNDIEAYYRSGLAGTFTLLGTVTEATYTTGGVKAMTSIGANRMTNLGGGNYVAPALPFYMQADLLQAYLQTLNGGFQ